MSNDIQVDIVLGAEERDGRSRHRAPMLHRSFVLLSLEGESNDQDMDTGYMIRIF